MIQSAVFLSIVLGFLSHEFLGIATGGLISGGYLALNMAQPLRLASTYLASILVFLLVRLMSRHIILFGYRRFMASILTGLVMIWLFEKLMPVMPYIDQDIRAVGYIIPGLIANDMLRQGVIKTTLASLLSAAAVRAVLIIGGAL
ncbi:MAG: poly-gamma-glutamate biosynthesis protein PgsC [Clostridiales bacterium]|nr:poly-gamma-glutamate biosynthesis protein PgsC [Clostridiales bacterium]